MLPEFNNVSIFTETKHNLSIGQMIDVASDLHIDQWDTKYKIKHPCGKVKINH
jgi:hypothetical protein